MTSGSSSSAGDPVKAFVDLNSQFQTVFSVRTFAGFLTKMHYPLPNGGCLGGAIGLRPTEISYRATPQGEIPVQYATTTLELVLEAVDPSITFSLAVFPTQVAQALFTPHRYGSLYACLRRTFDGKFKPTMGVRLTFPYLNLRVQTQPGTQKLNTNDLDCHLTVGTNSRGGCLQWLHRGTGSDGCSFMLYRAPPGRTVSLLFTYDAYALLALRMEREIRNWRIGVNFQCSNKLRTDLEVAWIAKLGRFTSQSTLKLWSEVKSSFKAQFTPQAAVVVTGELNHEAHAYRFGLALEWDQREPLPKRRGWFAKWIKPIINN
jgi:hypothetical protein